MQTKKPSSFVDIINSINEEIDSLPKKEREEILKNMYNLINKKI